MPDERINSGPTVGPPVGPTAGPTVARWGPVSSAAAPVLLIGGWTLAAAVQRGGFDQVRDTISALAGLGADHRWLMTVALTAVGCCHLATAAALRPAPAAGRLVLGLGGAATWGVAAFPLPVEGGSTAHTLCAAVAFGSLAVWPALGRVPGDAAERADRPAPLRLPVRLAAATTLIGLVGWFAAELVAEGPRLGLAERVAAGAQALWPLAVVLGAAGSLVARRR